MPTRPAKVEVIFSTTPMDSIGLAALERIIMRAAGRLERETVRACKSRPENKQNATKPGVIEPA